MDSIRRLVLLKLAFLAVVLAAFCLPLISNARAQSDLFSPEQRKHWAFQRIVRPEVPPVKNTKWVRNPIDAFILAEMRARGVEPSPPADKITLLRRASFDLVGLPPTIEEVTAFLADKSPNAFDKVVERLLASPHYGERWARHWLDLARYAESEGFKSDETRPNVWRYRDYLIRAFNEDKPYDRFIKEQIAGDELWPEDFEARIATSFNRHYPDESNARNLMQRRQEILNDITDTVGSVFLGLTFGCARCHDHKFDPILQADYYRLQAFFAHVRAADDIVLAPAHVVEDYRQRLAVWEEKTRSIRAEMEAIEAPKRKEILDDFIVKYPPEIRAAIAKPPSERTPIEWQMYYKAKPYLDPKSHAYEAPTSTVVKSLKGESKKRWEELKAELDKYRPLYPGELPIGTGIVDAGRQAPKTFILFGGVYNSPYEEVQPGFLTLLDSNPAKITPPERVESTGRRTALANWLVDPQNPLTSRVIVNRLWHYHFGQGLVGTPSNFGLVGDRATHPKLLDWLATEFMRHGWSIKYVHRLIVTSNAYRQSSGYREAAAKIDPTNRLLWRFPRKRLEGEVIRDAALSVSGLLNPKMGGPSIFPEVPAGMESRGGWKATADPAERNRRSIYVFVRRNTRYPMFETFDMPDTHESCPRRNVTTSPLQALTMLNNKLALEWAESFAGRVLQRAGRDRNAQVDLAYRLAYSRPPDTAERESALSFFSRHGAIVAERAAAGGKLAMPAFQTQPLSPVEKQHSAALEKLDPVEAATLVDFCHMLINANEFVYRN
ncbi:MAG TPA: DUF1549 and DUF1553 domain-containing protein [Acidobacteriota bacterium]|jgi:hypothetical protein